MEKENKPFERDATNFGNLIHSSLCLIFFFHWQENAVDCLKEKRTLSGVRWGAGHGEILTCRWTGGKLTLKPTGESLTVRYSH